MVVNIATVVAKTIAAPIPFINCIIKRKATDVENVFNTEAAVKMIIPQKKTFFLPYISASLPKGTRNIAAERRYNVPTQLRSTVFIFRSFPIAGNAIFIEEAP
jgi:hypothetical protein